MNGTTLRAAVADLPWFAPDHYAQGKPREREKQRTLNYLT